MSAEFLITTLIVVATPGTGVLYTLAAGLARGTRAAAVAALGCTLGIIPHMAAAITGLAALLHTSAVAFQVLKYAGVAYLLYMAWTTFRDKSILTVETGETVEAGESGKTGGAERTPIPDLKVVTSGVLINILNPKLTIFFFAFLPQFVATGAPGAVGHMLLLSGVFMAATFVVFVGYGSFAAVVRRQVISRAGVMAWLRRVFAGSFVVLAGRLAVTDK